MAENAVQPSVKKVDPMFALPEGVTDAAYGPVSEPMVREGVEIDEFGAVETVDPADATDLVSEPDGNNGILLDTPDILGVVSQTLRRSPGGLNVVDLVIDVEDIAGAANYEVRVTKA